MVEKKGLESFPTSTHSNLVLEAVLDQHGDGTIGIRPNGEQAIKFKALVLEPGTNDLAEGPGSGKRNK